MKGRLKVMWGTLVHPLTAVLAGFILGGIIIALSGFHPFQAVWGMLVGGYGSPYALTTTLTRAAPIIFAGLAGALAWGSGYSSLGAAGQMTLGALVCAVTASNVRGPAILVMILSILGGVAAGVLYSLISAWISERFQLFLLIITLMLNYVADFAASYFTTYVVKDPEGLDASAIQTQKIVNGVLPKLFPKYSLHWGFILAVLTAVLILFIMKKTSFGYKAKMGGLNPNFASYGGINRTRMMYRVLALSGAVAGFGGACEVLGNTHRYIDSMISSPGYAWSGVITTLMANNHPIGVLFSSIFLSGLTTGGSAIERRIGVPSEVTSIIEGIITLLVTAQLVIRFRKQKKQGKTDQTRGKGEAA